MIEEYLDVQLEEKKMNRYENMNPKFYLATLEAPNMIWRTTQHRSKCNNYCVILILDIRTTSEAHWLMLKLKSEQLCLRE